jgi:hypothetical protein
MLMLSLILRRIFLSLGKKNFVELLNNAFLKFLLFKDNRRQCKMSSSKKLTCKGTLRQVFISLRPAPLPGFCL